MKLIDIGKLTARQSLLLFITLLILMAVYVYHDFLIFNKLFLFKDIGSDTINIFYPRLVHIANYLRSDGLPRWSFNQGMGQSIFPISLGNPFEWPLFALGGKRLAYGIAYMEVLKIIIGGVAFYLYLRILSKSTYVCAIGGMLYAFSAFMILGGTWYNFSTEAVYLALLLYAFERWFIYDSYWLFPLVIALIASIRPFNLYTHAVFFLFYGLIRYFDQFGWRPRAMGVFFLRSIGLAILGAGMSAFFLFANVQEILQSQRVSGAGSLVNLLKAQPIFSFADEGANVTAIMRAFSSNMAGVGSEYHGTINYLGDPMFYCGLICLLLAPQVFVGLDHRRRILYGVTAFIALLPVALPYLRHAFWLFSGDYYRILSMFVALVVMLFAMKALARILMTGRLSASVLAVTLIVLLTALLYPYALSGRYEMLTVNPLLKWATAGLLCIYALLIIGLSRQKWRPHAAVLMLVLVCTELLVTAWMTVDDRPVITAKEFNERVGYNDYTVDAIHYLKKNDKDFYRVEKLYHSGTAINTSLNDAKVQNYWGTSSYHSFNESSYLDFLDGMGMFNAADNLLGRRWIIGLSGRPLLLSFASVRYLLVKDPKLVDNALRFGFRQLETVGNVHVLINPFALPLGFTYNSYITRSEFLRLAKVKKRIMLLKAMVLDDREQKKIGDRYRRLDLSDLPKNYGLADYKTDIRDRAREHLVIDHFGQNGINGRITLTGDRLIFFSIPFDKGWHAVVDGKPAKLIRVNLGFSGLSLSPGKHTIALQYRIPMLFQSAILSVCAILLYVLLIWRRRIKRSVKRMGDNHQSPQNGSVPEV